MEANVSDSLTAENTKLPLTKIRTIAKMDSSMLNIGQDAVFMLTKSTEMFIEFLAQTSNSSVAKRKKKVLNRTDIDETIERSDCLMFLEGVLDLDNEEILNPLVNTQ